MIGEEAEQRGPLTLLLPLEAIPPTARESLGRRRSRHHWRGLDPVLQSTGAETLPTEDARGLPNATGSCREVAQVVP